jgi:hypothetical protein
MVICYTFFHLSGTQSLLMARWSNDFSFESSKPHLSLLDHLQISFSVVIRQGHEEQAQNKPF